MAEAVGPQGVVRAQRSLLRVVSVFAREFRAQSSGQQRVAFVRVVVAAAVFVIDKLRIPMIVVATYSTGRMEAGNALVGTAASAGLFFLVCYLIVGESTHQAIRSFPASATAFREGFPIIARATLAASPGTEAREDRLARGVDLAQESNRFGLWLAVRKTAMGMVLGTFVDASATTIHGYRPREVRRSYAVTAIGTTMVVILIVACVQHIAFDGFLAGEGLVGLFNDTGGHERAADRTVAIVSSKWTWWGIGLVFFLAELNNRNRMRKQAVIDLDRKHREGTDHAANP